MAANSAHCKTWCITLVSAVIVFASDNQKSEALWSALLPIVLFFILDSYYLGLERLFRQQYNLFVNKLRENTAAQEDLFIIKPANTDKDILLSFFKAIPSISIWLFYVPITLMFLILKTWIF
jgi:hypothetical protein